MNGKWIYLAQRNPRLSREQFFARWLKHRQLGAQPAMAAEFVTATYCAVRPEGPALDGLTDEYDGVGVFALRHLASIPLVAQFLKQDYAQADEKRFFTTTSDNFSIFCAEEIIREGDDTKVVLLQFLRRKMEVGPSDFAQRWRESHASQILQNKNFAKPVSRYIQNTVIASPPGFGYSGIAEFWFDGADGIADSVSELNHLMADDFIDQKNSFCVLTDVIMAKPRK